MLLTDEQLQAWATNRADDAGRLARELVEARDRNTKLEVALRDLIERLDEIADAIKPRYSRLLRGAVKSYD